MQLGDFPSEGFVGLLVLQFGVQADGWGQGGCSLLLLSLASASFIQSCLGPMHIIYHLLTRVCPPPTMHIFGVSGGPGWLEDLTEEVDLLPEGQAYLLPTR